MAKLKIKDPMQHLYDEMSAEGIEEVRRHSKPVQRIRASEVASCARQIWYRLTGARPTPRTAKSKVYGIQGDADHDLARQMMDHYDIKVEGINFDRVTGKQEEHDTVIRTFTTSGPDGEPIEVTFSSRADGVLPETPRGRCLLEIKGVSKWAYKYLNEAFERDGHEGALKYVLEKKRGYEWQVEVTMRLFNEEQTYLLVKDRDSGTLGLWDEEKNIRSGIYIESAEERWSKILKHAAYIFHCLQTGEPPVKEYSAGSNECKYYCPFRYLCHDKDERIAKKKAGQLRKDAPDVVYPGPKIDIF